MTVTLSKFLGVQQAIAADPFAKRNYSRQKSAGPTYWQYRLLRPFLKMRYNNYQKTHPHEPWLCPDAIKALKQLLPGSKSGLEYGSGRSTGFFAPFFEKYVSIEHEESWYEQVKAQLADLPQVEYHLIKAEKEVPQQHLSSEAQIFFSEDDYPVPDQLFKTYSQFVNRFEDDSFDFILIDGRARKTCALNAIPKLKAGGLLVLDNSERLRYKSVHEALVDWPKIETTTGLTNTTIWRKP